MQEIMQDFKTKLSIIISSQDALDERTEIFYYYSESIPVLMSKMIEMMKAIALSNQTYVTG